MNARATPDGGPARVARCPWYRVQPAMRTSTGHIVVHVVEHPDGSGEAWGYRAGSLSPMSLRVAPDLEHPGTLELLLEDTRRRWRCPHLHVRRSRDGGWGVDAPGLRDGRLLSAWAPTRAALIAAIYLIPHRA